MYVLRARSADTIRAYSGEIMEKIVKGIIEEVEKFNIEDEYWEEIKKDTLKELERKDTSDNQYLWLCIKLIAEYMEDYVC